MLCGCSKSPRTVSTTHNGDLGQFILRTIEEHGGHARATNGLPQLQCEWRREVLTGAEYLDGREQVTIRITGDRFQQVTGFLAQALGSLIEPPKMHTNGFLHGWYSGADIGGGLQFYQGRNETGLILVGELKR
jgi:hypothetical protein